MKTAVTREELKSCLSGIDKSQVGFVPTMGALHEGHISLVKKARGENDIVVVSIFVNPTQFNDPNDLKSYPRTPEQDIALLESAGADIVFMPTTEDIYPEPDTRVFDFGTTSQVMEGVTRPGHFNGVAQVVSRLFELVTPSKAYFGEKDFQQIAVVNEMVEQLSLDVDIVPCPIVREEDGLAMSSRNALLEPQYRKAAPKIYASMIEGVEKMKEGFSPREVEKYVTEKINSDPSLDVIYFKVVNASTLEDAKSWNEPGGTQGCTAVQAGKVRLIDNIRFV